MVELTEGRDLTCIAAAIRGKTSGDLLPPPWVRKLLLGGHAAAIKSQHPQLQVMRRNGDEFALVTATLVNAIALNASQLEQRTIEAYQAIAEELHRQAAPHAVRFWNYIPSIHAPMDRGRDRYMVFNAGRFAAFSQWYGGADAFAQHVATASGVGHAASDLVIHCLAAQERGVAVENPRQIPPYRYSKKFGPLPPCFARATVVKNARQRMVLVGGTASIRGEESIYLQSLEDQTRETLENLGALLNATNERHLKLPQLLSRFFELRVYYPCAQDGASLRRLLRKQFSNVKKIEYVQADLCRTELLVEIEGVAR